MLNDKQNEIFYKFGTTIGNKVSKMSVMSKKSANDTQFSGLPSTRNFSRTVHLGGKQNKKVRFIGYENCMKVCLDINNE